MLFYLDCLIFINISCLFFLFYSYFILDDDIFIVYYSPHYTDDTVLMYHLIIEHNKDHWCYCAYSLVHWCCYLFCSEMV